jgi:hypothetical protein
MSNISAYYTHILSKDKDYLSEKIRKYPFAQLYHLYLAHKSNNVDDLVRAALYGNSFCDILDLKQGIQKSIVNLNVLATKEGSSEANQNLSDDEASLPDWTEEEINLSVMDQIATNEIKQDLTVDEYISLQNIRNNNLDVSNEMMSEKTKLNIQEEHVIDPSHESDSKFDKNNYRKKKKSKHIKYVKDKELSDFVKWLLNQKPLAEENLKKLKKTIKNTSKKTEVELVVEKSIQKSDQIASESLAKLLENQGYKQEAIEMYQQLSLLLPEKSTFFASQIEKLVNQ